MEFDRATFDRLTRLVFGLINSPPGRARRVTAWAYGIVCHTVFAAAVLAMIWAMFHGMSKSFGRVPEPWALWVNAGLVLQFPVAHSVLLSARGRRFLARLAPKGCGKDLATTS